MIRAKALVRRETGSEALLCATADSRKEARYRALGLIREGETLVSVEYEEQEER